MPFGLALIVWLRNAVAFRTSGMATLCRCCCILAAVAMTATSRHSKSTCCGAETFTEDAESTVRTDTEGVLGILEVWALSWTAGTPIGLSEHPDAPHLANSEALACNAELKLQFVSVHTSEPVMAVFNVLTVLRFSGESSRGDAVVAMVACGLCPQALPGL